ncbi:MAG TPA: hypothetical protein VLA14_08120, partial [Polyangia bacterium]|nr:hypothetical protein [Polyangia bacterium]
LTRFGDVARVADWILAHKPKAPPVVASAKPAAPAAPAEPADNVPATAPGESPPSAGGVNPGSVALPVGVAAPETAPSAGAATTAAP